MLKLVLFDTETTGLNPNKHALIQLSGKVIIGKKVVSTFDWKIRPFDDDEIEDEALQVNHFTIDELATFPSSQEVLPEIKKYFYQFIDHDDKSDLLTPVGFNIPFDVGFLRRWFTRQDALNSYKNIFSRRTIDTQSLVMAYFVANGMDNLESYRQVACANALGIKVTHDEAHKADVDSEICYQLFTKMLDALTDESR